MRAEHFWQEALAVSERALASGALVPLDTELLQPVGIEPFVLRQLLSLPPRHLAAGGPIVHPAVDAFVLTPIAPHTLSNRPIVVSDRSVIEITLKRATDARLHYDGQLHGDLREGESVVISRAPHGSIFLHPPGYSYFAMLREKLHWSGIL